MPEFPEVATICRYLWEKIQFLRIIKVICNFPRCIKQPDPQLFVQGLQQQQFLKLTHRGKYLIFTLTNYFLVSHLRMEGKFFLLTYRPEYLKHQLVLFMLDNGQYLVYHDTRRFGTFHLIPKKHHLLAEHLSHLGYEPFSAGLKAGVLQQQWIKKTIPIKNTLLSQKYLVGIGNLYASEILFKSKIHPLTPTKKITLAEINLILQNTRNIFKKAIRCGGTTIFTFQAQPGMFGYYYYQLQVYGRQNKPCFNCGNKIIKFQLSRRGTYVCLKCQPLAYDDSKIRLNN